MSYWWFSKFYSAVFQRRKFEDLLLIGQWTELHQIRALYVH